MTDLYITIKAFVQLLIKSLQIKKRETIDVKSMTLLLKIYFMYKGFLTVFS